MGKDIRKPTIHNMKRRSHSHDYSRSGYYHITISTAKALYQPLGKIAGRLDKPDGDSDAPHVVLSPLGQMVEQELRESIQRYYPMLEVMDYVVMPEHLHFLLVAHGNIVSKSGKPTHLGHVIAGFKYGCNKRYWAMTGRAAATNASTTPAAKPPGTRGTTSAAESRGTRGGEQTGAPGSNPAAEPSGTRGTTPAAEPPGTGNSVLGASGAKLEAGQAGGAAPLRCGLLRRDAHRRSTARHAAGLHPRQSAQPPA